MFDRFWPRLSLGYIYSSTIKQSGFKALTCSHQSCLFLSGSIDATCPQTAARNSWAPSPLSTQFDPLLLSTDVTVVMVVGWATALRLACYTNCTCFKCVTDGKVEVGLGGYLSLGCPHHVLLFLQDDVHTLKELHTFFWNPAKMREQIKKKHLNLSI